MLNTPTLEKLKEIKFFGMAKAFEEQLASTNYDSLCFEERLGLLVDREATDRDNRRFLTRLKGAGLRQTASIQDIEYSHKRGLNRALLQSLYTCQWIKESLNLIITGPTGVGKSYIACAMGHQACIEGYKTKYLRIPKFLPELAAARGDGTYLRKINLIAKMDLIILDDWGLSVFNELERRDILEILDDRHNRKSTIVTSQMPVDKWHKIIGDPTLADAIMDRLVHSSYRIELEGDSMRKKKSKLTKTDKKG